MLRVICNEFNTTLHWLKSGEEPMFRTIFDVESFIASLSIEEKPPCIAEDLKAVLENKNAKVQNSFHNLVSLFRNMTSINPATSGYDLLIIDTLECMLFSIDSCFSKCTEIAYSVDDKIEKQDFYGLLGKISYNINGMQSRISY